MPLVCLCSLSYWVCSAGGFQERVRGSGAGDEGLMRGSRARGENHAVGADHDADIRLRQFPVPPLQAAGVC